MARIGRRSDKPGRIAGFRVFLRCLRMRAMNDPDSPPVARTQGVFGFGIQTDGPSPQEQIDAELRRLALVNALLNLKQRGRRIANWRKELREPVLIAMAAHPEAKDAEFARILSNEPEIIKITGNLSERTFSNWLSKIRNGSKGFGREKP
jgi:hypothetical protein